MNAKVTGGAVLALGEIGRAQNQARRLADAAATARDDAETAIAERDQLAFAAKSQIHLFRSRIEGRVRVEDDLIAALEALNPGHPLASREAVDALAEKYRIQAAFDPEVIKLTWPSGAAPEGAIPIVNGVPGTIGGEPAYRPSTPDALRASQEHAELLKATGLDGYTILDPVRVTLAITQRQDAVAELQQSLKDDEQKGFFGRMKKSDRDVVETELATAQRQVVLLREAHVKAEAHVRAQEHKRAA